MVLKYIHQEAVLSLWIIFRPRADSDKHVDGGGGSYGVNPWKVVQTEAGQETVAVYVDLETEPQSLSIHHSRSHYLFKFGCSPSVSHYFSASILEHITLFLLAAPLH